jgi:hypothetical protein
MSTCHLRSNFTLLNIGFPKMDTDIKTGKEVEAKLVLLRT